MPEPAGAEIDQNQLSERLLFHLKTFGLPPYVMSIVEPSLKKLKPEDVVTIAKKLIAIGDDLGLIIYRD